MFKLRTLIATTLIAIAVVTTSLALTKTQQTALNKCIGKFIDAVNNCLSDHPSMSLHECQNAASAGYEACKKSAGIPLAEYPPPKVKRVGPRVELLNPPSGGGKGVKGQVWVNTDTRIYYEKGSRFYGKTKKGKYVSEADAIKEGAKPAKE